MSFQDLTDGRGPQTSMGGQQATREVESQVFKLASSVAQLKKLVDALGTQKDTVDHRHKIADLNSSIQNLAKGIKTRLTTLHDDLSASLSPEQQQKAKKLLQDFANILQDYKATQKLAADREMASLPRPNPAFQKKQGAGGASGSQQGAEADEEYEKQALLQEQKQKQAAVLDNAIAYNEALIEERDHGIAEIARQIGEVNEMFQDLAVLINDQGVQIQTIESNITATAERTKEGTRELVKAERSHRSYRNRCLWLWLIAAIVVSIIIILVLS
mmetsp:Transcript_5242/g.11478  ORF Transcript_5242/g.11478 Transcript_5242/m.11478 type:complete len:273 (-) Transcript_5242:828-1646(-)